MVSQQTLVLFVAASAVLVVIPGPNHLYLGIRTLSRRGAEPRVRESAREGLRRVYVEGVVVNLLNPKVILFFLAFLPQFVDPAAGPVAGQIILLGGLLMLLGLGSDLLYAVAAGSLGGWLRGHPIARRYQERLSGVVYIGLGLATALTGPSHRRA